MRIFSRLLLSLAAVASAQAVAAQDIIARAQAAKAIADNKATIATLIVTASDRTLDRAQRTSAIGSSPSYSASIVAMTPATNPTAIAYLAPAAEKRSALVRRITISATADAAAVVPVLIQRASLSNLSATSVQTAVADVNQASSSASVAYFSANPTIGGPSTIAVQQLAFGTSTAPATPTVFTWGDGRRPPTVRGLVGAFATQLVVNLNGATLPANARINMTIEWDEEPVRRIILHGDSLIDGAPSIASYLAEQPGVLGTTDARRYGNNGKRLLDILPTAAANLSGVNYSLAAVVNSLPAYGVTPVVSDVVGHFLTNDVRQGGTSQAQAISLLDAYLQILTYGCVSGQSWTSTKAGGAGTTFTWNATIAARPNVRVWLWGPNSYLTDDPTGLSYITSTGIFAGMTSAQAAQAATDIVYNAYQAFVGDPRLHGGAVVQLQDYVSPTLGVGFGRTAKPFAGQTLLKDTLHPGPLGEAVEAEQLGTMLGLGSGPISAISARDVPRTPANDNDNKEVLAA